MNKPRTAYDAQFTSHTVFAICARSTVFQYLTRTSRSTMTVTKNEGINSTRAATGILQSSPAYGGNQAAWRIVVLNTARGVSRFCASPPVLINSIPSMIIQAKGMPINVEAMFAKAIPENAWRGESDSNRRERTPSKRTIGANATIIAGNCNVIIGTPAFAIRMAVINLLHQWWVWPSPPTPRIKS